MTQKAPSQKELERVLNELTRRYAQQLDEVEEVKREEKRKREMDARTRMFKWAQVQLRSAREGETEISLDTGEAGMSRRKYPETGEDGLAKRKYPETGER